VVAVEIEDERCEIVAAVLGTRAGRSVVFAAGANRSAGPASHGVCVWSSERDVHTYCDAIATGLAADSVEAEVVAAGSAEQHIGVALEFTRALYRETKFGQCGFVHSPACLQIAHPDTHVVDDAAHCAQHNERRQPSTSPGPVMRN